MKLLFIILFLPSCNLISGQSTEPAKTIDSGADVQQNADFGLDILEDVKQDVCSCSLDGKSCQTEGFSSGELSCVACEVDTSSCTNCGNGIVDENEACDGESITETCESQGFEEGVVSCSPSCEWDISACFTCGDGVLGDAESCDGDKFGEKDCTSERGFESYGGLVCSDDCTLLTAGCFPVTTQMDAGSVHTCRLTSDGNVDCWGHNDFGKSSPPPGVFVDIGIGANHGCGILKSDGSIRCWGAADSEKTIPPPGEFIKVSSGTDHSCAIDSQNLVQCWGSSASERKNVPPDTFQEISVGGAHTCGVTSNGGIVCWGLNGQNQSNPPNGNFKSVSAGGTFTCGITIGDKIKCWGNNSSGQRDDAPTGKYSQIEAGNIHACAVALTGEVECWGGNGGLQTVPPAKNFTKITSGSFILAE